MNKKQSMESIQALLDLLNLEQLDNNLFRGQNYQAPWGRVFGGQVLAQSINAARRTVPADRFIHSMHGYFILGGDLSHPIIYQVDRIRDGRSFTTRRVVAIQKGRAIFNMSASFQIEEGGFDHQIDMPDVPAPHQVTSDVVWASQYKDQLPQWFKRYQRKSPIEFRSVEKLDPINQQPIPPYRHIWLKAKEILPNDKCCHQEVLSYVSDYNLMGTSLLPHRGKYKQGKMQLASLDHAMWFHHDFKMDDWLLYALDSPSASNSRGFGRGNFFNQEGKLVASVVQQGLIRNRG